MKTHLPTKLLRPKYWLSWLGAGLLFATVKVLPYSLLMRLGGRLGRVMEKVMPYRALIAKTNLELCFGEARAPALYRRHIDSLGKGILEMAMGWFLNLNAFHARVDHIGDEGVRKAQAEGRGILFLGIHTTNLDFCAPLLAHRYPVSPMYQKAKSEVFDYLITKARLRHCSTVIDHKNMREMLVRLKKGEAIWYGCDQDFSAKGQSVFVPFFAVSAYTLPSYAKLAEKTGAAVIPVAGFRNDKTGRYVVRYLPEIAVQGLSTEAAALAMNQAIEQLLEGYEEQYYWVHRRFKTRPEGKAAVYPPKPSHVRRRRRNESKQRSLNKKS